MDAESSIAAADRQQLNEIREQRRADEAAPANAGHHEPCGHPVVIFCAGCGTTGQADCNGADPETRFVAARAQLNQRQGWLINEDGDFCPACRRKRREAAMAETKPYDWAPIAADHAEVLAALDAKLAALEADSTEPDDTEMIGIDLDDAGPYAAVWVRQDQTEETGYAPEKRWWKVGGDPGDDENGPLTYREVIGYESDLPAGERRNVTAERVYTIAEIREMLPALLSQQVTR